MVTAGGTVVASYAYDAWGKVLTATGSMAEVNPIRYRGYYYDAEIGMYYLQSRYYDPAVKRFISADGMVSTGVGLVGYNMFSYCNNTPVMFEDTGGNRLEIINNEFDAKKDKDGNIIAEEVSIQTIFELLCQLTDDVLYLDGNQVRILAFKEGQRPVGTALLREIILSGTAFYIKDGGSIGVPQYQAFSYNAIGETRDESSFMVYCRPILTGEYPNPLIHLGHELIHVWRFATIPGATDGTMSPRGYTFEEAYTVGLCPWRYNYVYTENMLRAEHGLRPRVRYTPKPNLKGVLLL